MRWITMGALTIPLLILAALGEATGGTYPIHLRYQPSLNFPSLQQRLGSTVGISPFKDDRSGRLYIGQHRSLRGISNFLQSDPFPLEKAMEESLVHALSRYGIKTVPISDWDGKPESLKQMAVDSVLMIEIKRFWTEGRSARFRTKVNTTIYLTIHLGVKKEEKVFTQSMYVGKETTLSRWTPEGIEETVNLILTGMFDQFFSNPYGMSST